MSMIDEARQHAKEMGIDFDEIAGLKEKPKRSKSKKFAPIKVTCTCGNSFKHIPAIDYGDGIMRKKSAYCNKCQREVEF